MLRARTGGFSLLEVIVALAILGMALGALLEIFGSGINSADLAARYSEAATLAESRLAAVGAEIPLEAGETTGTIHDRYRWTLSIRPFQEPPKTGETPLMRVQLFEVLARVSWNDNGREREVALSTLQLGAKT